VTKKKGAIILIGMMGCGKTSIGKIVAARLRRKFADSDALVVEQAQAEIAEIFDAEGEESFRARESAALRELLCAPDNLVLAVGGGAPMSSANRQMMRNAAAAIVYLRATADDLYRRIAPKHARNAHRRPLLRSGDLRSRIGELLAAREQRYRDAADAVVEVAADDDKNEVAERVIHALPKAKEIKIEMEG
jgi:shikimate kinase